MVGAGIVSSYKLSAEQELIIRSEDCGTTLGVWVEGVAPDTASRRNYLETKLYGRALLNDMTLSDGTFLEANTILGDPEVDALRRRTFRILFSEDWSHGMDQR